MNNREVSYTFGPDKVEKVAEDGYELFAERQLVTIFSTPNNCGKFDEELMCSLQILKPVDKNGNKVMVPTRTCMETVQVLSNIWIRNILIIVSDLVASVIAANLLTSIQLIDLLCVVVTWDITKARKIPKRALPIICFREGSPPLSDASNTSIIDSVSGF
uniref:Uncharacterized protein n=1 Tax=Cucumis melo TaxID=3656 RepID=A0A9I9EJZ3_CUCME